MQRRTGHSRVRSWRSGLALWMGIVVLSGAAAATPRVERVSFTARADGQGYVIRFHTNEQVAAYSEPVRVSDRVIEITLFHMDLAPSFVKDAPEGPVERYTLTSEDGRIVARFFLSRTVAVNAYRDRGTTDLLVSLTYESGAARKTVEPTADARERWRLDTVVIDAGHGGKDAGATGVGGLREKDVVLAVALKLGQYLEDLLGVKVVYTRRSDRFVPLKERGRIANEAGGKLFISIHANSSPSRGAKGTETYFLGMYKTDAASKVMERENSVIRFETDQEHYKNFDEADLIRMQLAQSAFMRQSEQLAGLVEAQFAERVGRRSRGVKQAGFYVLWSASMPALLVELGFLSNPREAAFLRSKSGQAYMASAIFRAVKAFKNDYEKGLHLVSAE